MTENVTVVPVVPESTSTTSEPTAAELRAFADAEGLYVGSRGPISREVRDAYAAAQAKKTR